MAEGDSGRSRTPFEKRADLYGLRFNSDPLRHELNVSLDNPEAFYYSKGASQADVGQNRRTPVQNHILMGETWRGSERSGHAFGETPGVSLCTPTPLETSPVSPVTGRR